MQYTIGCDHSRICTWLETSHLNLYGHECNALTAVHAESSSHSALRYILRFFRPGSDFRTRRSKLPLQWRSCHMWGPVGSVGASPIILYFSNPLPLVRIPQKIGAPCFALSSWPSHSVPITFQFSSDGTVPPRCQLVISVTPSTRSVGSHFCFSLCHSVFGPGRSDPMFCGITVSVVPHGSINCTNCTMVLDPLLRQGACANMVLSGGGGEVLTTRCETALPSGTGTRFMLGSMSYTENGATMKD